MVGSVIGIDRIVRERVALKLDPATPAGTADTLISEAAIRAMYRHWREAMEL